MSEISPETFRCQGHREMLDSVRGSLRGYPNCGGDIEIMAEVERIVRASQPLDLKALAWLRTLLKQRTGEQDSLCKKLQVFGRETCESHPDCRQVTGLLQDLEYLQSLDRTLAAMERQLQPQQDEQSKLPLD